MTAPLRVGLGVAAKNEKPFLAAVEAERQARVPVRFAIGAPQPAETGDIGRSSRKADLRRA
jgi:hypothetical protein